MRLTYIYPEENLSEELREFESIKNYERKDEHGVIHISYELVDHREGIKEGCRMAVASFGLLALAPVVYGINGVSTNYSYYFDARDGGFLGTNRNRAAENLSKEGCKLFENGDYINAKKYQNNAYHFCSVGYRNEQLFKNNRDMAQVEIDAMNLNFQGDQLFTQRKYAEARNKYQEAYDKSQVSKEYDRYISNRNIASAEASAANLNDEGIILFNQKRYDEAERKFWEAYDKSQIVSEITNYRTNRDIAKVEATAANLNSEGNNLFNERRYDEAERKFQEAYVKSQINSEKTNYRTNRDKAEVEATASNLNSEGNNLFNQGKYSDAQKKYQEAYNKSQISSEKTIYRTNRDKAEVEATASNLNSEGNNLFNQRKYSDAQRKYQEAYDKSHISSEKTNYRTNRDKADVEATASNLNSEGNNFFNHRKYSDAQRKYQEASEKSKVFSERNRYSANNDKAKAEIDSIKLNSSGNNLFCQGKYDEAHKKYQEAYDKSRVIKEKNIYKTNKDKTQLIINELTATEALWNEAWDAEENGRSGKAEQDFQQVLLKCKNNLLLFPDNLKFKQYEALVSLKVAGNELFNQGLKLHHSGNELFKQAQELKQEKKYELANEKFKEAKDKYTIAQEKFEAGSSRDPRFVSCIKIVEEQINQIIQMVDFTEQNAVSQGLQNLKITTTNVHRLSSDFCKSESNVGHQYHAQI